MRIAGYQASLVDVRFPRPNEPSRCVRLWEVADLEQRVDRDALLRDEPGVDPPYWALSWSGAHAIASGLFRGEWLHGRAALDLGAGLGLAGLAAALQGASVTFVDQAPESVAFVGASAGANGIHEWSARNLDFTHDRLGRTFDLVLAADVVYETAHHRALARFLDEHVASPGAVWITDRLYAPTRAFFDSLEQLGFEDRAEEVVAPEMGETMRTVLHRLRRR